METGNIKDEEDKRLKNTYYNEKKCRKLGYETDEA